MILLKNVRVYGFRGLKNIEVELTKTTVLTGMNNSGKTSFLKALQIALGNKQIISQDDFYVEGNKVNEEIIIDLLFVPVDKEGKQVEEFSNEWEIIFQEKRLRYEKKIKQDEKENSFVALRIKIELDENKNQYVKKQFILNSWVKFYNEINWYESGENKEESFYFEEIPFFYMEAQRDILEDIKLKSSYIGRMISKIKYKKDDIEEIEDMIDKLNMKTIEKSEVLTDISETLGELKTAMNNREEIVEITPFTKKIRDLNKGLSIHYGDGENSFSMDYHGMGTRSWASILTLKAFIKQIENISKINRNGFFPIIALEEPESHLHPNAQKKIFNQIDTICGQKIISTHSPYIAASADLSQIRSFYKDGINVKCGKLDRTNLTDEDIRKINRRVINTRGELFFSKVIVLFEGETEEQVLPVLAKNYFKMNGYELGVDFIGVGGGKAYLPFIIFAECYNIPWIIFSDGEQEIIKKIEEMLKKYYLNEKTLADYPNVIYLDNSCDFEKYLIKENYTEEILKAFIRLHNDIYFDEYIRKNDGKKKQRSKTSEVCEKCNQNIYTNIIRDYFGDEGRKKAIYDCMISQKTKFGSVIGQTIIESGKKLPPKIRLLFISIRKILMGKGEANGTED